VPVGLGEIISLDDTHATIVAVNGADGPIRQPVNPSTRQPVNGLIEFTRPPRLMPSKKPRIIEFPADWHWEPFRMRTVTESRPGLPESDRITNLVDGSSSPGSEATRGNFRGPSRPPCQRT
jgi:hypothetical protein